MPHSVNDWSDLRNVAPEGATHFSYRRATGERRKYHERGYAFLLEPEQLTDRRPTARDGLFNIAFWNPIEAAKPVDERKPLMVEPPDGDELQIEFPKGVKAGDGLEAILMREQQISIRDMARVLSAPVDSMLRFLDKVTQERDAMAKAAEENRFGPFWTLIHDHADELKTYLQLGAPLFAAFARKMTARLLATPDTLVLTDGVKELRDELGAMKKQQAERDEKTAALFKDLAVMVRELRGTPDRAALPQARSPAKGRTKTKRAD